MSRFIVFANGTEQCGKTTTAVNVAYGLAARGRKVLLIDLDPLARASISLGRKPSIGCRILQLLSDETSFQKAIVRTRVSGLFLIPASAELRAFEHVFSDESLLAETLDGKAAGFDYVILNPPSAAGLLMRSVLTAANEVFIPVRAQSGTMEGLAEMMRLIYTVNASYNPGLRLGAIIPTFTDGTEEGARELAKIFGEDKIFPGIRLDRSLADATRHCRSVFEYFPQTPGALDYLALSERIDTGLVGYTRYETIPERLEPAWSAKAQLLSA
ncbi:MAG: ParA family protein [Syntrophobacteraceae bacterium]